jgi:hypothetical protein
MHICYVDFDAGRVIAHVTSDEGDNSRIEVGDGNIVDVVMEGEDHQETTRSQHPRPSRAYGC